MMQLFVFVLLISGVFCQFVPFGDVFNLVDYGGVGDGVTLNTQSFEKAVAAIEKNGGGTLYVPAGGWLTGPFNLTSHMTLFVANSATVYGVPAFSLWPVIPPLPSYGQGRDHPGPRHTSLVHGENITNVTVMGEGDACIDGQGQVWWEAKRNHSETITRGHLIEFLYSKDVTITNIRLENSPFWTVHPYDCYNVTVRNVIIRAPADSPNTDGVDPDSCDTVLIENVDYFGGDDGIAIKSGWDCFGIQYGKPTTNVIIRNMTVGPNNCIAIGSEMSGGVENVTVEDVHCLNVGRALYIKASRTRGGYVRNITFNRISIDTAALGLNIQQDYGSVNPSCPSHPDVIAQMDNIVFRNVTAQYCTQAAQLIGFNDTSQVTNIVVESVHLLKTTQGFQCQDVSGSSHDVQPAPCVQLKPIHG